MRSIFVTLLASVVLLPLAGSAQTVLPIGRIPYIGDRAPSDWAYSGYEILRIRVPDGPRTPIMRTETLDARLVEILSRTEAPPLRASDIRAITRHGEHYVVVRHFLLAQVRPQDARASGMTTAALARTWAAGAQRVLPKIAPQPSRFGL